MNWSVQGVNTVTNHRLYTERDNTLHRVPFVYYHWLNISQYLSNTVWFCNFPFWVFFQLKFSGTLFSPLLSLNTSIILIHTASSPAHQTKQHLYIYSSLELQIHDACVHGILRRSSSSSTRFCSRGTSSTRPPTCSHDADMLASSPSPSAALRPASSSSPAVAHSSHSHSHSQSHSLPFPTPSSSQQQQQAVPSTPPAAAHLGHYDPVRSSVHPNNQQFSSPRSSRVAIEELRSALTRHTVDSPPHGGPSGDLPRGRMPAGLTSLGGGSHPTGSHCGASNSNNTNKDPNHNIDSSNSNSNNARSGSGAGAGGNPLSHPSGLTSNTTTNTGNTTTASSNVNPPSSTSSDAPPVSVPSAPVPTSVPPSMPARTNSGSNKRNSRDDHMTDAALAGPGGSDLEVSQSKRLRPSKPAAKVLPRDYEQADPKDIVILISSMLMELIRFNDKIPLHQGRLTRFHSRSPPRISVLDYLQRLTTHATLSPPILLSMVYYIDRLCALYPAFTVSSLTIHRFLIASVTVASKGLSDSFWTNKTYARVGGISLTELALLELEFLFRVEWKIVPQPEVLVDYYQSLVERCDGYEIQRD